MPRAAPARTPPLHTCRPAMNMHVVAANSQNQKAALPPRSAFYDRLKEVKDYHKRFPSTDMTEGEGAAEAAALAEEPRLDFSGEESLGRFLDLHEHHHAFQNVRPPGLWLNWWCISCGGDMERG